MIYIEPEHRITVTFTNTEERNDISIFYNVVSKCYKEAKKPGFHNMFSKEEKNTIKMLAENLGLNKEQPANGLVQIGPTAINVINDNDI